jgi:hypothetical protein
MGAAAKPLLQTQYVVDDHKLGQHCVHVLIIFLLISNDYSCSLRRPKSGYWHTRNKTKLLVMEICIDFVCGQEKNFPSLFRFLVWKTQQYTVIFSFGSVNKSAIFFMGNVYILFGTNGVQAFVPKTIEQQIYQILFALFMLTECKYVKIIVSYGQNVMTVWLPEIGFEREVREKVQEPDFDCPFGLYSA